MEMTPLALVVLLAFGLLLAVSLTLWTATGYMRTGANGERGDGTGDGSSSRKGRERSHDRSRERSSEPATSNRREQTVVREKPTVSAVRSPVTVTGRAGRVRGSSGQEPTADDSEESPTRDQLTARTVAVRERTREPEEDAFERFLRAGRDDTDFR